MSKERVTTLENVKVGDTFMEYKRLGWNESYLTIVTCERVTPKQCVIGNSTYRKSDARCLGEGYSNLFMVNEAELAADAYRRKVSQARSFLRQTNDFIFLSDERVVEIAKEVKAAKLAKEGQK